MADSAADAFIAVLTRLIAVEEDEQQKGALIRLKAHAVDVAKGILSGAVVTAAQVVAGG